MLTLTRFAPQVMSPRGTGVSVRACLLHAAALVCIARRRAASISGQGSASVTLLLGALSRQQQSVQELVNSLDDAHKATLTEIAQVAHIKSADRDQS